jgi:hypothetical protein
LWPSWWIASQDADLLAPPLLRLVFVILALAVGLVTADVTSAATPVAGSYSNFKIKTLSQVDAAVRVVLAGRRND